MTTLDWTILITYLLGLIGLSAYWGRAQASADDYYVGGRNLPWWALGISAMATQSSAISFISIPAFVALKSNGGLSWLQYELAVPLAMIFVMAFLIPFFRHLKLISVYRYLEQRFGPGTRYLVSTIFLISRGVGTAAGVYATAIILSVCLGTDMWVTLAIIGVVTIIYDMIGGMNAVVYSDVLQMIVLFFGVGICIFYAADLAGGLGPAMETMPAERWRTVNPEWGLTSSDGAPFWAYLIGGLFLYTSYYGVDQTQAQRGLCAPTVADSKRALMFNGFARFPLTLLYLTLGMAVGGAYWASPELQAAVPDNQLDQLVPQFVLMYLPSGLRAIIIAALLAAAMSSLDSSINSLSAVTIRDFVQRGREIPAKKLMNLGRIFTAIWGTIVCVLAAFMGSISETVIETVNKVGSASYGPVLATFLVGVLSRKANAAGVVAGLLGGMAFNLSLWLADAPIHWMWWNVFGFLVTLILAMTVSRFAAPPDKEVIQQYTLAGSGLLAKEREWFGTYVKLGLYFILILGVAMGLHFTLGA